MKAYPTGGTSPYTYSWTYNPPGTSQSGCVNNHDTRDYSVTVTDNLGATATDCIYYHPPSTACRTCGTKSEMLNNDLENNSSDKLECDIYPNPTNGWIKVNVDDDVEILVINIEGKIVYEGNDKEIDISKFGKGVYIIKIGLEDGENIAKFIVE